MAAHGRHRAGQGGGDAVQDEIAGIAPLPDALATAHLTAVSSKNLRDSYVASAMEETRRLNESLATGRDAASRLRHYIKSVLGIHSEKLSRYGMNPRRKRPRSAGRPPVGPPLR